MVWLHVVDKLADLSIAEPLFRLGLPGEHPVFRQALVELVGPLFLSIGYEENVVTRPVRNRHGCPEDPTSPPPV